MVHWVYIGIAVLLAAVVISELFRERRWREQIALGLILIPLILRILHVK